MNISCRIANADTQCGRITNPPERVSIAYRDFRNFVKNEFKTDLTTLFVDEKSEEKKIKQLDIWWNSYINQGR